MIVSRFPFLIFTLYINFCLPFADSQEVLLPEDLALSGFVPLMALPLQPVFIQADTSKVGHNPVEFYILAIMLIILFCALYAIFSIANCKYQYSPNSTQIKFYAFYDK